MSAQIGLPITGGESGGGANFLLLRGELVDRIVEDVMLRRHVAVQEMKISRSKHV